MPSRRSAGRMRLLLIAAVVGSLAGARETIAAAPPTKAQAVAFARAVNLVAADVPGFAKSRSTSSNDQGAAIGECAGDVRSARPLLRAVSPDFESITALLQFISSTVTVVASPRKAARDIAIFNTARGRRCLRRAVARRFHTRKSSHISYGHVTLSFAPQPAPGSDGSFKLRVRTTVSQSGLRIPLRLDVLGFRLGSSLVTLLAGGGEPVPSADEQRLFSLLLMRATTNRL